MKNDEALKQENCLRDFALSQKNSGNNFVNKIPVSTKKSYLTQKGYSSSHKSNLTP